MNRKQEQNQDQSKSISRRSFLRDTLRGTSLAAIAAAGFFMLKKKPKPRTVWQIDPQICVSCGNCANYCVLELSAVKCVHAYSVCGYCDLCSGYFNPEAKELDTGAENQLCPTGAIKRSYVEDPYFQYVIDEPLCIGCAKCVKGCNAFGNGSLFLQVRHDRCVNCNECSIAAACPSGAFKRIPADKGYLLKESHS